MAADEQPRKPLKPEEFAQRMRRIEEERADKEYAHKQADKLLCRLLRDLGYGEGVEIFENMDKWYA